MALEIEDGTGVADATSFVTIDEYVAWAIARGFAVPMTTADPEADPPVEAEPDEPAIEILAVKSIDYIKAREREYGGDRFSSEQALPFPRVNLEINGVEWDETDPVTPIPQAVKDYQLGVMKALADGIDLFPTTAERAVKRKKTGILETEWFDANLSPTVTFVDALVAPLLGPGGGFALTVRRI